MPAPLLPLFALLGAGVALAAATKKPRARLGPGLFGKKKKLLSIAALRPSAAGGGALVNTFGIGTAEEYPAPYRFQDAQAMAVIVLPAASETSPKLKPFFTILAWRMQAIDNANLPPWRKTYATILTVIIPAYASNLLWHWYRPVSTIRQDHFNAIVAWAALFFSMPVTATAKSGVNAAVHNSSFLPDMAAYLDPATQLQRGGLSPPQMRRALIDVYDWMRLWPSVHREEYGWGSTLEKFVSNAALRLNDINNAYPVTGTDLVIIQGNLKLVDEIVWVANARVQGSISVDFDEGDAIVSLVLNIVAVVVSAVAPLAGPAIAAAISGAANAAGALARMIVSGDVDSAQIQAMAGAGVSLMLDQAGIRLGLEKELTEIQGLKAQAGL